MNIVLDIIAIAIFIITVVIIAKRGFVKSLIGVVGFVAAIILSLTLAPLLAEASYSLFIENAVYNSVAESVTDFTDKSEEALTSAVDSIYSSLPSFVAEYAEKVGLSSKEVASTVSTDNLNSAELARTLCDNAIKPAVVSILNYILSLVLFIPLIFVFRFVAKLIRALIKGNILGKLDRLLGSLLGIGLGAAFVVVFCLLISLISNLLNLEILSQAIDGSFVFKTVFGYIPF